MNPFLFSACMAALLAGCATPQGGTPGVPSDSSASAPAGGGTPASKSASMPNGNTGAASGAGMPSVPASKPGAAPTVGNPGTPGSAGAGPVAAKTPDERRAEADKKLDASLGDFDAQVRKEQARIAREREQRRASRGSGDGSGSADGAGADERGGRGRRGDGDMRSDKAGREERGDRRDGDMKSDNAGPNGGGSGKGPSTVPPGVGSGENDDLVARQLREAAEKETDPELRDKLWKEYQDYKKSVKR